MSGGPAGENGALRNSPWENLGSEELQHRPGRVAEKKFSVADVAREHRVAGVPRLGSDLDHRDAGLRGAGREAGAEAVA